MDRSFGVRLILQSTEAISWSMAIGEHSKKMPVILGGFVDNGNDADDKGSD